MSKETRSPFSFESAVAMLSNNFIIVLLVLVAFVGGFFAGSLWTENQLLRSGVSAPTAAQPTAQVPGEQPAPPIEKLPEITDADHILGSKDAPVIIVEYSDMNCPFCRRFHPTMKQIVEEFGNDVAWVYRHFPFQGQNSTDAAVLSECVADTRGNEAFWEFTNGVYTKADAQGSLSRAVIDEAALEIGLSASEITECIASEEYQAIVQEQSAGGSQTGVTGTPASILVTADGPQEFINGALPFEQVKATVEQYL